MAESEWTRIFNIKVSNLRKGDSWGLEFDDSIVPNSPKFGWEQYIRNTGARFRCSRCGRTWPSNRVMVVFHMQLKDGQGVVKVRRFCQNCKRCYNAPMERPSVESDNIDILMESLMEKIRIKCYHEDLGKRNRPFRKLDVNNPHEPSHCEACRLGICTQN
ncbi:receptor-transporting protein 3-like [Cheilinus undulatus]|uniref:receptor-transporting protein 3-like n=1 Tax=Cheilinus undulatus TaxID=241271 RepID=UPI001BD32E02|nr:receptor-transporting protein 3-like [Cheilinus undulatus]